MSAPQQSNGHPAGPGPAIGAGGYPQPAQAMPAQAMPMCQPTGQALDTDDGLLDSANAIEAEREGELMDEEFRAQDCIEIPIDDDMDRPPSDDDDDDDENMNRDDVSNMGEGDGTDDADVTVDH